MADTIDSLQIEINAKATKANDAIDRLVGKLDRLTTSMSRLDGSNLASFANGVQKLGTAMQTMNNVKTADFSRLARNLQNLNNIDASKLSDLSVNIKHIATAFNGLSGMEKGAEQITALANGIKQLGYSSAEKAITNIPQLATAMKKLMEELSTAPKVSQNLIDMTNALAKLARTGSSSGKAANSIINSFNGISKASKGVKFNILGATSGIKSLGRQLLSVTGIAGGFYAVFNGIKKSMDISSDLTEVQNVVDVTFGDFKKKIEDLSNVSIPELGMSELTAKQVGSRFQAMGTAIGIAQGKMADMSVNLTRLTGDMASFYNVSQQDMGKSLQSIFTGETEPLRRYGIDLTQATLQEWALKNGIDANINSMTQMEKTMLRYQYVISNTKAAQGDFIRTQDTWANQVRVLQQNFQALGSIIGGIVINSLKPLVKWINIIIAQTTEFAKVVSDALGTIFGWTYEEGGGATSPIEDMANGMEDVSNATDDAANAQKKYNKQLAGFDELNNYTTSEKSNISSALGGGTLGDQSSASYGTWKQGESIIKGFESDIDTLYKLGDTIGDTLKKAMDNIDWDSVYKKAENFGSDLASFLNGLFSEDKNGETVLGSLGKTIAGTLNTVIYSVFSFSNKFEWFDFGNALKEGIQNFLNTADLAKAGYSVGNLVKGISTSVYAVVSDKETWVNLGQKVADGINGFFESMNEVDVKTGLTGWQTLGKDVSETFKGIGDALITALDTVDWDAVGQGIGDAVKSIDFLDVTWKFVGVGHSLFNAVVDALTEYIKTDPATAAFVGAFGVLKLTGLDTKLASLITTFLGVHNLTLGKVLIGIGLGAATLHLADSDDKIKSILGAPITAALAGYTFTSNVKLSVGIAGVTLSATAGFNLGKKIGEWISEKIESEDMSDYRYDFKFFDLFTYSPEEWKEGLSDLFSDLGIGEMIEDILSGDYHLYIPFADIQLPSHNDIVKSIKILWKNVKEWWKENVKLPKIKVPEIGDILSSIRKKWGSAKEWWSNNVKLPSIKIPEIKSIKDLIKEKWDDAKEWWRENVKFPSFKFTEITETTAKKWLKPIVDVLNSIIEGFNKLMKLEWKDFKIAGKKIIDGGSFTLLSIPKITGFEKGGFPEDGWFRASKGEYFGQFDDGTSYIANNKQIENGIAIEVGGAVRNANAEQNSLLREQNELLRQILRKETGISSESVFNAVRTQNNVYKKRYGESALI